MTTIRIARMYLVASAAVLGILLSQVGYCDQWDPIEIADADRLCKSDGDCVLLSYTCDHCDCGTPINSRYRDKYHNLRAKMCVGYNGGSCRMRCDDQRVQCVKGRCVLVKVGPSSR
jgi:hypothetical protein